MIKETKYKNYFASDDGKIYSSKIKGGQGLSNCNNLREMAYSNKSNYLVVCLSFMENGKQKRIYKQVHKLVYETFNGEIENNMTIDHINNNSLDNRLCNLQLLDRKINSIKRDLTYHFGKEMVFQIKDNSTSKILEMSKSQIAKYYNLSYKQVSRRVIKGMCKYFNVIKQIN